MADNYSNQNQGRIFEEGSSSEKTDYTFLLNRQIERVAMLGTNQNVAAFVNAVEILDSMLEPYKDSMFDQREQKAQSEMMSQLETVEPSKRKTTSEQLEYLFARIKFKELMNLMSRKAFIPTRRVSALDQSTDSISPL